MDEICYEPIGVVESPFETPADVPANATDGTDTSGTVRLEPAYREGLCGLEGFSHVVIVAHLHLSPDETPMRISPPFAPGAEPGVFATSSPVRPNNIALTIARLTGIEATTISVEEIDLVDGTPVLDVKPFAPKEHELEGLECGWLDEHTDQ